jgi:GNAT superfamily N-acetyltransferase
MTIRLRDMQAHEYESYTTERERDTAQSLAGSVPEDEALAEARAATARFLPDGLQTVGHRLLVAENADGEVVGCAWLGLHDPRTGSPEQAWLYDIRIGEDHRRRGYAGAMLAVIEDLARAAGATTLGLNVFGHNRGAVALYEQRGYVVTTQQMAKSLEPQR